MRQCKARSHRIDATNGTDQPNESTEQLSYPGAPRWAKILGIGAGGLVVLFSIIFLTGVGGPHGPGRHLPSSNADGAVVNNARQGAQLP